jgi:hypothetical protein
LLELTSPGSPTWSGMQDGPARCRSMDDSPQAGELISASPGAIGSAAPSIVPELPGVARSEAVIAIEPRVLDTLRSAPRSVARRITERLMLGVAALALYAAWVWLSSEGPRQTQVLRGTIRPEEIAPRETTAAITAPASNPSPPPWFSPQLFYVPSWMPPPSDAVRAGVPLPLPRPTRQ